MPQFEKIGGNSPFGINPIINFTASKLRVDESEGILLIELQLSEPSLLETKVSIDTKKKLADSVNSTQDLNMVLPLNVSIPAGNKQFTVSIPIVNDSISEAIFDEILELNLEAKENGITGTRNNIVISIRDDDYCTPARRKNSPYANSGELRSDPITICTRDQLNFIGSHNNDLNKNFLLKANINMAGLAPADVNSIGNSNSPFLGKFNGNQYTVSNFYLSAPTESCVGFFGKTGGNASIQDLTLQISNVEGKSYVGGLVGCNAGSIERSSVSAYSSNSSINLSADIGGGLCGENTGTISDSFSTINILSGGASVGGLVGSNRLTTSLIKNSYATGIVSGESQNVGGFVGSTSGDSAIYSNFSGGDATGGDRKNSIGLFIGLLSTNSVGTINENYHLFAAACTNQLGSCHDPISKSSPNGSIANFFSNKPFSVSRWDFFGQSEDGVNDVWTINPDSGLPNHKRPASAITIGPSKHFIFVSSETHSGDMGGLTGADLICSQLAKQSEIAHLHTRNFKALLSDSSHSAIDRIKVIGPIYNTNDRLIAENKSFFWDGRLNIPVNIDENGQLIETQQSHAWTGTQKNGSSSTLSCMNWSTPNGTSYGGSGSVLAINQNWIEEGQAMSCANSLRIYCISSE